MSGEPAQMTGDVSVGVAARMELLPFEGELSRAPVPAAGAASLYWLGQAGFLVKVSGLTIVIDPYLSDSLAAKYAGTETPHDRMMRAPVAPDALDGVDFLLCSHRHTDHLDPETVLAILDASPEATLIAPRAVAARLEEIGVPVKRTILVNAGDTVDLSEGVSLSVTASAHEALDVDGDGNHPYVGFALRSDDLVLFHSGDCVPYEGLAEIVADLGASLALFPINGRKPDLSRRGIAGNFSPEEAAGLCDAAGIPNLIFHHFGMFAFNTADPEEARDAIAQRCPSIKAVPAAVATEYRITPNTQDWSRV